MKVLLNATIYWTIQAIGVIVVAYAGQTEGWKVKGFVLSNLLFVISIYFLIRLCGLLQSNIAFATAIGGAFLLSQISLSIIFKTNISFMQFLGISLVFAGILLMALGKEGLIKF